MDDEALRDFDPGQLRDPHSGEWSKGGARIGRLLESLAKAGAGGAFQSRENPDSYMDWATVRSNGDFGLEVVGDDGEMVRFDLSPAELAGLHAALTDKVAVMGQDAEADDAGGFFPDADAEGDDGRWFDWSDTVDNDHYRLDLGAPDGEGGIAGTTIDMSSLDMQDWHTALTITLLTHGMTDSADTRSARLPGHTTRRRVDERKFNPGEARDPHGQWTEGPGGAIKDALNLAKRIELGDGESLAGSDVVRADDSVMPMAWVHGPGGMKLRLGTGIGHDDEGRWRAADKGSTVVLDEAGARKLAEASRELREAGTRGKAKDAELGKQVERLEAKQRGIIRRQYPGLSKDEARELDEVDASIQDLAAEIERDEARAADAVASMPPAAQARHAEINGEIETLIQQRHQIQSDYWGGGATDQRLFAQAKEIDYKVEDLIEEQDQLHAEGEPVVGYAKGNVTRAKGRRRDLENARRRLSLATARREELTQQPVPLSAADEAELHAVGEELDRVHGEWGPLMDGGMLASGVIPAEWGDLAYQATMTDTGPDFRIAVRPQGAGPDWAIGDDDTETRLSVAELADLERKLAEVPGDSTSEGRSTPLDDLTVRALASLAGVGGPDGRSIEAAGDEVRKFHPDQLRDPEGQWSKGGGIGGAIKDALKLAGRIQLGDGETLSGSDVLRTDDGSSLPMAWTHGPSGARLRLGIGIPTDDEHRWRGADKGSTVVLDEAGAQRVAEATRQMREAGAAGEAKAKELDKRAAQLEAKQRELIRRQYPNLTKAQAKELDDLDEKIQDAAGRIASLQRQQDEAIGNLPPAARARHDEITAEIDRLRAAGQQAMSDYWAGGGNDNTLLARHKAVQGQVQDLLDEQMALHKEREEPGKLVGYEVFFKRRRSQLVALERELDAAQRDREELTTNSIPLSAADASELEVTGAELERTYDEHSALIDEPATGIVPAEWGDVAFRVDISDGDGTPSYQMGVRPPDADEDWYLGRNEESAEMTADELAELERKLTAGPGGATPAARSSAADTGSTEGRSAMTDDLTTRALAAIHGIGGPDVGDSYPGRFTGEERQFDASSHPRAPVGAATGGQFAKAPAQQQAAPAKTASGKKTPVMKGGLAGETQTSVKSGAGRKPRHVVIPKGSMGYDPAANHGTGYGSKAGDKNVHTLQEALNRLGFSDLKGRKLTSDGKLGPLTTSAVRKAQRALGVKADGLVTPEFLKKLADLKSAPNHKSTNAHTPAKPGTSAGHHAGTTAKKAAPARPASKTNSQAAAKARAEADAAAAAKQRLALAKKIGAAPAKSAPAKPVPRRSPVKRVDYYDPAGRSAELRKYDPGQLRDPHSGEWAHGGGLGNAASAVGDALDEIDDVDFSHLDPKLLASTRGSSYHVALLHDPAGYYTEDGEPGDLVAVEPHRGGRAPWHSADALDAAVTVEAGKVAAVADGIDHLVAQAKGFKPTEAQLKRSEEYGPILIAEGEFAGHKAAVYLDPQGDLAGEGETFVSFQSSKPAPGSHQATLRAKAEDWRPIVLDAPLDVAHIDARRATGVAKAMREMAAESKSAAAPAVRSRPHAVTFSRPIAARRSARRTDPSLQRRSAAVELCTRAFDFEFEARSSSSGSGSGGKGDGRDLEGYAAVFNTSTRIRDLQGDFDETILPGAFSRSISRRMPVLQFDHGKDPAVGGAPIGKITHLAEDSKGLHVRARLFADASISRVREAIAEQAISGMSFRFGVPQGGDEWKRRNNDVDLREIRDTDIHELGPVVFPAYDATSVSVRSILSGLSAAEVRELVHELRESFGLAVDLRALDGGAADAYDEQDEEAPHAPRGNRHSPAADSFGASFPPDANGRATGGIIPPDSPSYWVGERGPETVIPRQRVAVHGAPRSTSDPQFLTGRSSARRADGGDTGTTPRSGVPVPTRTAAPATAVAPQSAEESRLFARALHAIGAL